MRLIILPLSIDVSGVREVEESGSLHAILMPIGDMKGEVIINQNSESMALKGAVKHALVLAVTVREATETHFNIKAFIHSPINTAFSTMNDNFVDYGKELLIANETQKSKIEFLERERLKRDHLLSDLQENLAINKQTLREYNQLGENSAAVQMLTHEAELLVRHLKEYYNQYQDINASLLVEQQMRLSDRQAYEERLVQFENKMVDLRKYLHDKEESFTSVVLRLKRYEDFSQTTTDDKLVVFKKEIGERHVSQFIADLIREKNYYQQECENMKKNYIVFQEVRNIITQRYKGVSEILEQFEKENGAKIRDLVGNLFFRTDEEKKYRKIEPNLQLIRLLKKEKLNNQLLEDALTDAIDKNQELQAIREVSQKHIESLENKCQLLHAENTIFALRLADFDSHYCRAATHHRRYYEEGEIQGLKEITEDRLKQYVMAAERIYANMDNKFTKKLDQDMKKLGKLACDAAQVKRQFDRSGLLMKSCSVPRMIVDFELEPAESQLVIEQY